MSPRQRRSGLLPFERPAGWAFAAPFGCCRPAIKITLSKLSLSKVPCQKFSVVPLQLFSTLDNRKAQGHRIHVQTNHQRQQNESHECSHGSWAPQDSVRAGRHQVCLGSMPHSSCQHRSLSFEMSHGVFLACRAVVPTRNVSQHLTSAGHVLSLGKT